MISKLRTFNEYFSKVAMTEFLRLGVKNIFVAPGSRSTSLVLAAESFTEINKFVHFDERGLGFYALGCARATNSPVVIITTSGTAVANLYPAIIEAYHSHIPLIICSADRPFELRDTGANQAIDQNKIFGKYVRYFADLPCPSENTPIESLLTTIDQAVFNATQILPGPVHLNWMFQEPLVPNDKDEIRIKMSQAVQTWFSTEKPFTKFSKVNLESRIPQNISDAKNGILLLGSNIPTEDWPNIERLCNTLNWPIIADIQSQFRLGSVKNLIPHADLILEYKNDFKPDLLLQIGGTFTSKHINNFIKNSNCEYIQILGYPERLDPLHLSKEIVQCSIKHLVDNFPAAQASKDLFEWKRLENKTTQFLNTFFESPESLSEPYIAYALSKYLPDCNLYLSSSRPIRDMDRYSSTNTNNITVYSNRGTSGIDGNLATLAGTTISSSKRTYALIGDLATLHDLNSLALLEKCAAPITFVLINNNGGGIFSFLPVSNEKKAFEKYFGTPHNLEFEKLVSGFDINYFSPQSPPDFFKALEMADLSPLCSVIEIKTDRNENFDFHKMLAQNLKEHCEN